MATYKNFRQVRIVIPLLGAASSLLCAAPIYAASAPSQCTPDLSTKQNLTQPSGPASTVKAGDPTLTVSTANDCTVYLARDTGKIDVTNGGTAGNVILTNGGSLTVRNGATVGGYAVAGETMQPSDGGGNTQVFGGAGNIVVEAGGTLSSALIGTASSLTVGNDAVGAPQAQLGWVTTSGTTTIQNTLIDTALGSGKAPNQYVSPLEVDGGTTTVSNSTIVNSMPALPGKGLSGVLVTSTTDSAVPPTSVTLNMTNTTVTSQDGLFIQRATAVPDVPITVIVDGSTLSGALGGGLSLLATSGVAPVSVTVSNSTVSGSVGLDASVAVSGTTIVANKTAFTGTSAPTPINQASNGVGVYARGSADITLDHGSSATGTNEGILLDTRPNATTGPVIRLLDGTRVQGGAASAAIHIVNTAGSPDAVAQIGIASGSTLAGGNGNIIQADGAGKAVVQTDTVNLAGNVVAAGAGSQLTLNATKNSTVTGLFNSSGGAQMTLTAMQSSLNGNVTADGTGSQAAVELSDGGNLNGNVIAQNGAQASVVGDHASSNMAGSITADNSAATVQLSGGAHATGGLFLNNGATGTIAINGKDSALARADGAAISVDGGSHANVTLSNDGQLRGLNDALVTVTGASQATVNLNNTTITGDMSQDAGSTLNVNLDNAAALNGNLAASSLTVQNGATWNMGSQTAQSVGALSMNGGTVNFNSGTGPFKTLTASSLQGAGAFTMGVDFKPGTGNDLLVVKGTASGAHTLDAYGEDQGVENPRNNIRVVQTGGGAATFGLLGGKVDAGIYTYNLEKNGDNWELVRNDEGSPDTPVTPDDPGKPAPDALSPAAKTALSLASATPMVFYGEIGTLRQRQGDLRLNRSGDGVWARSFSNFNQLEKTAAPAYDLDQYGGAIGADKRLTLNSGDLYVGGFGSYSYSTASIGGGSTGRISSYGLGTYATWMMQNGWYVDGVLKVNNFENELNVRGSDGRKSRGKYNMPGIGGTLEVGKHIALPKDGFMEPYAQIAAFEARSSEDKLNNGFDIHNGNTKSVQGQIGMLVGQNYEFGNHTIIQPYIKGAVINEFVNNNRTTLNNTSFTEDMSGTRMLAGLGVAVQIKDRLQVHLDVDYTAGGPVDQTVGLNLGVRYAF